MGTDAEFELVFTPDHGYHARSEPASMATNFHQLFGRFHGWVSAPDGRIDVTGLHGFTESQYLRW